MTIEELAKRKAELKVALEMIAMCNVAGKSIEELSGIEMQKINALKQLYQVEKQIDDYVKAA